MEGQVYKRFARDNQIFKYLRGLSRNKGLIMAKKQKKEEKNEKNLSELANNIPDLPDDAKKKLEEIRDKLEKFKEKALEKFNEYILGIALLPPSKDDEKKEKINIMLLLDDSDSTKMSKDELRDKLSGIMVELGSKVDKSLNPEVLLLSDLWQNCYDGKLELLQIIASAAPIHDKGMLAAIKISEVHKSMVLKKFEKYIVSYVLAGSLVQGKATPESDIDVFIVIDDTDVKKMTRAELKDKLRAIIIGMGIDAGKMTGIENKINIQVYILTDFWEYVKEANPIIFTFLRDGVPLYDRGIFMPWKQLLQMGRVRPSPEAIDIMIHTGDQMLERVKYKLKEIGMEDFFWASITTAQAALMLYGLPPPTPKEAPEVLRDIFVKKEKMLEDKYVKIVEHVLKTRKDMEHGTKKDITGQELDELYNGTKDFLERMKKLFSEIESLKEKEEMSKSYEEAITTAKTVLGMQGVKETSDSKILEYFKTSLVDTGKMPLSVHADIKDLIAIKKEYDSGKLSKAEANKAVRLARSVIRTLIEFIQRTRSRAVDKAKITIKYGPKYGEVLMLGEQVFIVLDVDEPEKEIQKAILGNDGKLSGLQQSSFTEMESAIASFEPKGRAYIKEKLFEDLKGVFGKDMEVLVNY